MKTNPIGSARMEPTEDTTVRLFVERADGETETLFLEPGNGVAIADDGPIMMEAYATQDNE